MHSYQIAISVLLFCHWLGDFGLQTSKMAYNKSTSLKWLTIHVSVYSACLFAGAIFILSPTVALLFTAVTFLLHFITDYFTSKWAAKHREIPKYYFKIIGLDQFIHGLSLVWTYYLLTEL